MFHSKLLEFFEHLISLLDVLYHKKQLSINMSLQVDFSSEPVESHGTSISKVQICVPCSTWKSLFLFCLEKDFGYTVMFWLYCSVNILLLQVVYMGLHIVTPLITLELLKYPKLCHDVSPLCHLRSNIV